MGISSRVDVVVAPGTRAEAHENLVRVLDQAAQELATVDVTPDPNRRIIFLAATKQAGYDEARALGIEPVAVMTPRSLDAARGITADAIEVAADLTVAMRDELMPHALPSLATSKAE